MRREDPGLKKENNMGEWVIFRLKVFNPVNVVMVLVRRLLVLSGWINVKDWIVSG